MSDNYRTKEEYAERFANDRGITVEEAKQTAAYKAFAEYHDEKIAEGGDTG
jgi:hypothetical protein